MPANKQTSKQAKRSHWKTYALRALNGTKLKKVGSFTVKPPSVIQRSVSQENAFKKSRNPSLFSQNCQIQYSNQFIFHQHKKNTKIKQHINGGGTT